MRAYLRALSANIREAGALRLLVRAVIVAAISAIALALLVVLLPGLEASRWQAIVGVVFALAVLNALVRPLIVLFAVRLPLWGFGLTVFLLDATVLALASRFIPGFSITNWWTAIIAAPVLAAITTLIAALLHINDLDVYYLNVIRRLHRDAAPPLSGDGPGTVIVQIDGLSLPVLERALAEGRMPTLQRWLDTSHRLAPWECDVPSMTSSGQAGILWGNNANIPAFRWFDKDAQQLMVSNRPANARLLDELATTDHGLLRFGGSSIGNIFTGGAERSAMTMATVVDATGRVVVAPRDFATFFLSPYNCARMLVSFAGEFSREVWQSTLQRVRKPEPRLHRSLRFALVRAGTNVFLRDMAVWLVATDMTAGKRVLYIDLLGYDEVAHHAGPLSPDAIGCLEPIDAQLRILEEVARNSTRPYGFVVLSDHGQSWGATFYQRYGLTLEDLIRQLIHGAGEVFQPRERAEGVGYISAAVAQLATAPGVGAAAASRVMRAAAEGDGNGATKPEADERRAAAVDIVVCGSGNLGLISFTRHPARLTVEEVESLHPGLLDGLVQHPGIGWLLMKSDSQGIVVLGKSGVRRLLADEIVGDDPLAGFPPATSRFLLRLAQYPNVPDIVINSTLFDAETGEIAAFEELIGAHGGAGGWQTKPFVAFPAEWMEEDLSLEGAEAVHAFLARNLDDG